MQLCLDKFHDSMPRKSVEGISKVYPVFDASIHFMAVEEMLEGFPICDDAVLILASVLASLVRSCMRMAQRHLKEDTN